MNSTKHNLEESLISVIIPAYNAEEFITKTLESVLSQTYQNIEIFVVDDGSTDTTAEIVKSFAQKDSRVTLLQQANAGVAVARNLAYLHSKGEYIAPIDADDIWYPQNLEKQVECLTNSEPFVGIAYSWSLDINEGGLLTGGFYNSTIEGEVHNALVYKYFIGNASSSLIRRTCFEKVGGYNCKFKLENAQGCEDWELHLRIAQYYQFKVVPEYLVGYRQISSSMSCNYAAMAKGHSLIMADVRRYHSKVPEKVYCWSSSNFYIYLAVKSNRNGNYRSTLFWLAQAFKEDLFMALLRHNLYLLSIKSILRILVSPPNESGLKLKQTSEANAGTTIAKIETRTKVHRMLPSQIYERMRFNSLTR
ncbi:MAG: glycosyltransferase family 2 protein [Microcoleus sp. PH2017_22_RUC_O_B]|uniref:glycosyltransferase family 2 protein n=1 Tax=unclassified Microcoleus TaxID=2642155 RepID=UPI001D877C5C|nr:MULTISPECIES: glycosyltransferase family A protein [unclassified Microcoleus]MCC3526853.1 glycosyltransferase family 2 protein [Microcoleus sp. PH2017_21_RUC_O_A]MCC3539138.1 glycosyltransferase family 2 protein [Microcoleus sp. PH2017_22_RUC_O_B]